MKTINWLSLVNSVDPEGQAEKPVVYKFSHGVEKKAKNRDGGDGIYDEPSYRQAEMDRYYGGVDPTP